MARIVVADDDPQIRVLIRRILQYHGLTVEEAADGVSAVEACRREGPDVLIVDLIMPEKEGLETIREVQQECPAVKVIAISGGGIGDPEPYLTLAERLGADRVLAKPFGATELMRLVREVLPENAMQA